MAQRSAGYVYFDVPVMRTVTTHSGRGHTAGMRTTVMNPVKAFTLTALGLAIAAMGIYVADADDAPGAAVIGMLLMVVGVVLGVRAARNRLPM